MIEIVLAIFIIVVLAVAFFLYQEVKEHQKVIETYKNPSHELLHSAWKKADDILAEEKKFELKLFEKRFQDQLDQLALQISSSLEQAVLKIEDNFSKNLEITRGKHDTFVSNIEKQTLQWQDKLKDQMNSKVNSLLLNFEENLTNFLARAEQESLESINLELRSARQLIDSYKSQQLSLVDENIVAVLERTMNLVLNQKLTLKDQIDLVYEALEKAKLEKFFA